MAETIQCPHCETRVGGDALDPGEPVDCPDCSRSFLAPQPRAPDPDPSAGPAQEGAGRGEERRRRDVPLTVSGLLAAVLTGAFYLAVIWPLSGTSFGDLFGARGWVPYVISFLSIWSAVLLGWKYWQLRAQNRIFELDLLPPAIGERVTPETAAGFLSYLRGFPADLVSGFLAQRVTRTLEQYQARPNVAEAVDQLRMQADRDEAFVESSFTMLRVFIWAIPILGFIGTVTGIGQSVGGFSESVAAAADLDVMKDSIGAVTSGLGVAFDTTLLALVMSIFIMFPTSSLQKAEEDHLARVDEYCQRQLIGRLEDRPASAGGTEPAWTDRVADRLAEQLLAALERQRSSGA